MRKRVPLSICYILVIAAVLLTAHWGSRVVTTMTEKVPLERKHRIIIDAGHGGIDGGATSCSGILESTYNLDVCLRLDDLFHLLGYETRMIRTTDISVYTKGETIAQKKISDLKERVRIVNETENALLLSIHQNNFTEPEYSGAQVFFRPEQQSQLWASKMQEQLRNGVDSENRRQPKEIPEDIYLMSHVDCPAILVECGFLSNPEEDQLLQTPDYQSRLAVVLMGTCLEHWT